MWKHYTPPETQFAGGIIKILQPFQQYFQQTDGSEKIMYCAMEYLYS